MKDIYEAHKLYEKKKKEEYEAMIRGMSKAGKHWGRIGAQKTTGRIPSFRIKESK